MSRFKVEITGTAWLKSEVVIEASDKAEAEKIANEKFDELEWEIVEMDRPVIMEVTAEQVTNICETQQESHP